MHAMFSELPQPAKLPAMNDELQPKGGDAPEPSHTGEIPQVKFPIRVQLQWLAICIAGVIPGLFIVSFSQNKLVDMVGFSIALGPLFWVIRQIYLHAQPFVQGYVIDTTRDRFCFNVTTVKMIFPVLLAATVASTFRESGAEARLNALTDSLVFDAFILLLSGFVGHFTHGWFARRRARGKTREN